MYLYTVVHLAKNTKDAIACVPTAEEYNYLNFAETKSEKPRKQSPPPLLHSHPLSPSLSSHVDGKKGKKIRSNKPFDH
jgi:hypothetical protein